MASSAGAEFTSVFTYNGSNFGDMTLEAQSPAGTSFGAFVETTHLLYLGHDSKFDMAPLGQNLSQLLLGMNLTQMMMKEAPMTFLKTEQKFFLLIY